MGEAIVRPHVHNKLTVFVWMAFATGGSPNRTLSHDRFDIGNLKL